MLARTDRYSLVPYEQISTRPWCGYEAGQMQENDPRFMPLMERTYGHHVEAAKILLRNEVELCYAPYSSMYTACVLLTERPDPTSPYRYIQQMLTGHRKESVARSLDRLDVVTAVEMALGKIAYDDETIGGVYLTGRDLPGGKLKRAMPIPTDYDHIVARFSQDWGPPIFIILPDSYDSPGLKGVTWILPDKHIKTYAQHEQIVLSQYTENSEVLNANLRKYTPLKEKDITFVADLTRISTNQKWTAFFTGSASGLGEITPALTNEYDDMDFIIAANDPEQAEALITKLAEHHYGPVVKVQEIAHDTHNGVKIKGFFLYNHAGKKLIQLAIGKSIDEVCFRPDVIERNSGIWLNDNRQSQNCRSY